ncbi:GntR family transcriptional repressor for pyruvate dehydrogenase complex [Dysgonomonadaceae bacterium PH5-43]|nr:GntR family transcriptional repressor for pyruvate dehydrogenase complex [Dysgonomonadaceae bacterium PH5-43]
MLLKAAENKTNNSEDPVDLIIKQIKEQLSKGLLNPGDKLPSERKLADNFGIGRTHVRTAIKRLEFYGILKTFPQIGTFVAGLDVSDLETLIQDALEIESYDLYSLAETRLILETNVVRLSCKRRTEKDLHKIEFHVNAYEKKINTGIPAIEEDLSFHRQIAEASKNTVLKSMMLIITPDLMTNYRKFWNVCDTPKRSIAAVEHRLLLEYIRNKDEDAAVSMITQHLKGIMEYARSQSLNKIHLQNIEHI